MKLLALALLLLVTTLHADTEWKAGAAKARITPQEPMWMSGYSSRTKPAEGTALDLFAKALVLEDAHGQRFVFVTLDLIGVPRTLRAALEKRFEEAYHLSPDAFLLNASHTHCGPEYRMVGKTGIFAEFGPPEQAKLAEAYGQFLEDTLFKLVGDAIAQLAPAKLTYHHARCGFAMNRRLPVEGVFHNSPNPEGPVDQAVPVLRVASADGDVRAILFGYACHNTTLSFYQWCGDYAGYAQQAIETAHPGAIALFVQGCGGDQNPYPRGKIELAQFHGKTLATAVRSSADLRPARSRHPGPLREKFADVEIDFAPVPTTPGTGGELAKAKDPGCGPWHARRLLDQLDHGEKLPEHCLPTLSRSSGLVIA